MSSLNVFAISAVGLCLAIAPVTVGAKSAQSEDENGAVFVPLVNACVSAPTVGTCQQVRAVVAECASDLDYELCSVLFEDAEEVFEDPTRLETSQMALSETVEVIATMEFPDVEHSDIGEFSRADAERTLLRGDENLMTHSAPQLLEGDAPTPDTETGD